MTSSNKIFGLGTQHGINLVERAEALYRKDGLWNNMTEEELAIYENKEYIEARDELKQDPTNKKLVENLLQALQKSKKNLEYVRNKDYERLRKNQSEENRQTRGTSN